MTDQQLTIAFKLYKIASLKSIGLRVVMYFTPTRPVTIDLLDTTRVVMMSSKQRGIKRFIEQLTGTHFTLNPKAIVRQSNSRDLFILYQRYCT